MKITLKTEDEINDWNAATAECYRKWLKCGKEHAFDKDDRKSWRGYQKFPISAAVHGVGDMLATPFVVNEMCLALESLELKDKVRVLSKGGFWPED